MYYFTKNDEYAKVTGTKAVLGLSKAGMEHLGDVTFVELPEIGTKITQGAALCALEAVKAAVDYYSPLTGTVIEVNTALQKNPELMNKDPEGQGWIAAIEMADSEEVLTLMGEELYGAYLADEE